jgi:transcriptional regulator with XRE-family HTH domain
MWVQQKDYAIAGSVLAQARRQAGLGQKELAAALKKPQSFVSSYEIGQRRVDVLEFLKIADALDADPMELFRMIVRKYPAAKRRS